LAHIIRADLAQPNATNITNPAAVSGALRGTSLIFLSTLRLILRSTVPKVSGI
jgi:hypothetical protein